MKNWNQSDLAKRAGVAVPTIANIEAGKQKPGVKTLKKIRAVLDKAGIEFTDHDGIRKKSESVRIFYGQEEYKKFFDFLYEVARDHGGPIYLNNVEESYYEKWHPDFFSSQYFHNMSAIKDRFDFRILVKRGNDYFPALNYAKYRWLPEDQFTPIPFEVFGDYLAIKLLFMDEPIIFLIRNKNTADLYREIFLKLWENSTKPPGQ